MHDYSGGGSKRARRFGTRAFAGIGALSLVAAGMTVWATAAGAQTSHTLRNVIACEVTDIGGINDHSFNASAYAGLKLAAAHPPAGVRIIAKEASSKQASDYVKYINGFIADKCNIIVTVGFLMTDATWNAAVTHPHIHFAIVDNTNQNPKDGTNTLDECPGSTCKTSASNLLGLTYETNQDGFLGGYEAAATSKTGVVATYGGEQFSSVTIYMDGFAEGIAYWNAHNSKQVSLLGWNFATQTGTFVNGSNPFNDPTAAAAITNADLSAGASTVFPVAGGDGLGTTAAVQTWNSSHPTAKANVEWVDTNGCTNDSKDCNIFISSVTKGVTASVKAAVLLQAQLKFKGGNYVGTLKNGGAAFIENTTFKPTVSAAIITKLNSLKSQIISGAIKVKT
jgi:basic membrane protein A